MLESSDRFKQLVRTIERAAGSSYELKDGEEEADWELPILDGLKYVIFSL